MKKTLSLLLAVLFVLTALVSCTPSKKNNLPEKQVLENVYLTTEHTLPEDFYPQRVAAWENEIYIYGYGSHEEELEDGGFEYTSYLSLYATDAEFGELREVIKKEMNYDTHSDTEMGGEEIESICISSDGRLFAFYNSWYENWSDMENIISETSWSIAEIDKATGEPVGEKISFDGIFAEDEWGYISTVNILPDGRFLLSTYNQIIVTDPNGAVQTRYDIENTNEITVLKDGRIIVTYYDENWNFCWGEYSLQDNTVNKMASLPQTRGQLFITSGGKLYMNESVELVEYDLATGEKIGAKINWINSDINSSRITGVYEAGEEFIACESVQNGAKLLKLSPCDEVIEKYVITFGALWIDYTVNDKIVKFNRANDEYRISVKLYDAIDAEGNSTGDKDFDNDILQGKMPDIVSFSSAVDYKKYATKSLLADIGALIDADEEVSRQDFVENVLKAGEYQGKLVSIIPEFSITSVTGKKAVVGDRTAWTWADFEALMRQYPDARAFGDAEREGMFRQILQATLWDFVDLDTGECRFETDGFKSLLNFAKTFPETIDWDSYYEDYDWEAAQDDMKNDKILLSTAYFSSPDDLAWSVMENQFGEDISYIGYPTASGKTGSAIEAYSSISISNASPFKEQAFDFVKELISEESYENTYSFPINKKAFDKKFEKAVEDSEKYGEDENGAPRTITKEIADSFKNFVLSVERKSAPYNHEIIDIILEESAGFMNGEKSLEETCRIIQSRAFIFVTENM